MSGAPLDLGFDLAEAQAARDSAIATSMLGNVYYVRMIGGAAQTERTEAPPAPDVLAISPGAKYAALYYGARRSVSLLELGEHARMVKTFAAPAAADQLAVSDTGGAIAIAQDSAAGCSPRGHAVAARRSHAPDARACDAADTGGLRALNVATGEWREVAGRVNVSSVAFLAASDDVVYADEQRGVVALVSGILDQPASRVLLEADARMTSPAAVQSGAGSQIIAAAKDGAIVILDSTAADAKYLNCRCEPTRITRLPGATGLYVLTEFRDGVVWVVDASTPRVLFVPPEKDLARQGLPQ
jgi:hypothetical protein